MFISIIAINSIFKNKKPIVAQTNDWFYSEIENIYLDTTLIYNFRGYIIQHIFESV